jgi:uncharacterized protein
MAPDLTDTLCTICGLCCDGTLFADVELGGEAEAARLTLLGLETESDDSDVGLLSQPCRGLQGTRCGIYAHRPRCCRDFECSVLQDARSGAVSPERAAELIADARRRIRDVRALLARIGKSDARLPLKERCAEVLARGGRGTPEASRLRDELETAMAALEAALWNTFLGVGEPRGAGS